jgi:hypothetical protein
MHGCGAASNFRLGKGMLIFENPTDALSGESSEDWDCGRIQKKRDRWQYKYS